MERGLGCSAVIPAGWIGFAGLADYAGPKGWLGFAEFMGWIAVCVAVGLVVAALLGRWRKGGARRYISGLMAVALVAAFTYAPHWLGFDAPMSAKIIFTTTLQVVGTLGAAALVLCGATGDPPECPQRVESGHLVCHRTGQVGMMRETAE